MKRQTLRFGKGFRLALRNTHAQAATMVLKPGDKEGGSENDHRESDQWLFVVEGEGVAIVNRRKYPLRVGVLMVIERGDLHEIRATGSTPLRTLNLYVPPAYQDDETPLPAGRHSE
jgi:mannose-6-phosphate isomerase-like protein (cupin superfamily)